VRVFWNGSAQDEVAVKSRLAYVPDYVAFLSLDDRAGTRWITWHRFRKEWNRATEKDLLGQFRLDDTKKGQRIVQGAEDATGARWGGVRGAGIIGAG